MKEEKEFDPTDTSRIVSESFNLKVDKYDIFAAETMMRELVSQYMKPIQIII